MWNFSLGDRVYALRDHPCDNRFIEAGDQGTICHCSDFGTLGVRWDYPNALAHHCQNHCEDGYGWYVHPNEIGIVDDTIVCDDLPDIMSFILA